MYDERTIGISFVYKYRDIENDRYETVKEIFIDNIIPDAVSYDYSPSFSGQGTLGRMSPIQVYSGGSNKNYSFSLTIHEDMLANTKYDSIEEFVDDIKSLSYPVVNDFGIMKKPSVFYEIGDIVGAGIIKTNISWKKPFRNGRYVIVEIAFNITEEISFPPVSVEYVTIETRIPGSEYLTYNKEVRISQYYADKLSRTAFYNGTAAGDVTNYLTGINQGGWDGSVSDLIGVGLSSEDQATNIRYTRDSFSIADGILDNVYSLFSKRGVNHELLGNLESSLNILGDTIDDLSEYKSGDSKLDYEPREIEEFLDAIYDDFEAYLDHYYDSVATSMTREEYDRLLGEVRNILDELLTIYEAVYDYGASN